MDDEMIKNAAQRQAAVMERGPGAQQVQRHGASLEQHGAEQQAASTSCAAGFSNDLDRHSDRLSDSLKEVAGGEAAVEAAEQWRNCVLDRVMDAADRANRVIREALSQFADRDPAAQQQGFDRVEAAAQLAQQYALDVDERSRTLAASVDRAVEEGANSDQLRDLVVEARDDLERRKDEFDRSLERIAQQDVQSDFASVGRDADAIAADTTNRLIGGAAERDASADERRRRLDSPSERDESHARYVNGGIQDKKFSDNTAICQLWHDAVLAARESPDLSTPESARAAYDNAMKRFLTRLVGESPEATTARKAFEDAGFKFLTDEHGELKKALPWLDLADVENGIDVRKHADLLRVSGQHLKRVEEAPERALDPDNLAWMVGRDNIHMDANTGHARSIRAQTVDQMGGSTRDNIDAEHGDVEATEEQRQERLREEARLEQERNERIREDQRFEAERDREERETRRVDEEQVGEQRRRARQEEEQRQRERQEAERTRRQEEERSAEERRRADERNR